MGTDRELFRQKAHLLFTNLDLNHDDTLSSEELRAGFEMLRVPHSMRDELLRKMHFQEGKGVTKEEFEQYIEEQYYKVKSLFDRLDFAKDRSITLNEFIAGVRKFYPNYEISKNNIKKLFDMVDQSKDGVITFDEWCDYLILMPKLSIKSIINYWETILTISDPLLINLYGVRGIKPPSKLTASQDERKGWFASLGAGLLAGICSRTGTAPFDRLKLLNQVHYKGSTKPPGLTSGLKEIYKRDGFRGLFRGNLITILKTGPETSIRLTVFEKQKSVLEKKKFGRLSLSDLFTAGAVSGVISTILTHPFSVVKVRLATAPSGTYNGIGDTMKKMKRNEGPIVPFFKGIVPTTVSVVPNSGLNLMSYEVLKRVLIKSDPNKEPSTLLFMVIGGISGLIASTAIYPFQIVGARIIMQGLLEKDNQRGMVKVAKDIFNYEGAKGFFKGYQATMTRIIFENAISFGCFESLKKLYGGDFKGKNRK